MNLGRKIAFYRKKLNITQEALAGQLGVTNQAVSKWEADQCCPDISLLPKMADIFEISLDELFDREFQASSAPALPWADDGTLRAVLFVGRQLVSGHPAAQEIQFQYEGPALNVTSELSIICDDVQGSVTAGASVTCDDVHGNVQAASHVTCDCVDGDVSAGADVNCDEVAGNVQAGRDVRCGHLEGNAIAGNGVYVG